MPNTNRAIADAPKVAIGRSVAPARSDAAAMKRPADNGALLAISEECVGRRVVLLVAGEVDISNATDLRVAIESAAGRAFEVWLDLSSLRFIDSSGLHAMSEARARLTDANTRLTLICPEGPVLRALTLTGFDRIFEIHGRRSEAHHATHA